MDSHKLRTFLLYKNNILKSVKQNHEDYKLVKRKEKMVASKLISQIKFANIWAKLLKNYNIVRSNLASNFRRFMLAVRIHHRAQRRLQRHGPTSEIRLRQGLKIGFNLLAICMHSGFCNSRQKKDIFQNKKVDLGLFKTHDKCTKIAYWFLFNRNKGFH